MTRRSLDRARWIRSSPPHHRWVTTVAQASSNSSPAFDRDHIIGSLKDKLKHFITQKTKDWWKKHVLSQFKHRPPRSQYEALPVSPTSSQETREHSYTTRTGAYPTTSRREQDIQPIDPSSFASDSLPNTSFASQSTTLESVYRGSPRNQRRRRNGTWNNSRRRPTAPIPIPNLSDLVDSYENADHFFYTIAPWAHSHFLPPFRGFPMEGENNGDGVPSLYDSFDLSPSNPEISNERLLRPGGHGPSSSTDVPTVVDMSGMFSSWENNLLPPEMAENMSMEFN
jgi:hypothetical protein